MNKYDHLPAEYREELERLEASLVREERLLAKQTSFWMLSGYDPEAQVNMEKTFNTLNEIQVRLAETYAEGERVANG